jgi:hypothetical protein
VESIRAAAALVAAGRCLWRAADDSGHVRAVVACAQAMSKRLGWLTPATQPTQSRAVVP